MMIIDKSSAQLELCKNFASDLDYDTLQVGKQKMIYFTHERTWDGAFKACEKVGMRLVTIENEEENNALYKYFTSRIADESPYGSTHWYVWTSGSDAGHEGHFVWKSTGQNVTYTAWGGSDPNGKEVENCIELKYTWNGKIYWNDSRCGNNKRYICETDNVNQLDL